MKKSVKIVVGILSFIIAITLTSALYFSKITPFSTPAEETDAAAEEGAASQAAEATAEPAEASFSGQDDLVVILPESFDQNIEANEKNSGAKESADSWVRMITLINSTARKTTAYLFLKGKLAACTEAVTSNCVRFPSEIPIEARGSVSVPVEFTKIALEENDPVEGTFILAGGGLQEEYPFSIQGAWQKPAPNSREDIAGYVLEFLLVLLVFGVLFIILYSKVVPFFLPARFLPLQMDVSEETRAIWEAFSSQLSEMKAQGLSKSLINPQEKVGKIELPTNLGKEGDILRAAVELLGWVLPRRGISIRLQSVVSESRRKGVSIALVKNSDNEMLSERSFWAGDYGFAEETEGVEQLLMIPVIYWLVDWWERRYHKRTTPPWAWKVEAYCSLAGELWSKDHELAKRLYMDALFFDPANRQAHSGLGRIWLEDSQKNGLIKYEKSNYLELAITYLQAVANDPPKPQDMIWFASNYSLAVALMYADNKKKAGITCDELFKKIDHPVMDPSISAAEREGFLEWLAKFNSMALIFKHSVLLENAPLKNEQELKTLVQAAIADVTSNSKTPHPQGELLLTKLDYRSQYNAACYFSRCYHLAKDRKWKAGETYAELALDYLRMSLGHGGGLKLFAREDQALAPLRKDFKNKFEKIAPKEEKAKAEAKKEEPTLRLIVDGPVNLKSG